MSKNHAWLSLVLISALSGANAHAVVTRKAAATTSSSRVTVRSGDLETDSMPLGGRLEIEPNFGFSFISPGDVNSVIRDQNDGYQKQGVKSFNLSELGSTYSFGGTVTYRVLPVLGLGVGVNRLSASTDSSAKVGQNSLNGTIGIGATLLTAQANLSILRSNNQKFEALFSPFAGIGFYNASSQFGGSALEASSEVNASARGAVFGAAIGTRYWLVRNLAWGVSAGYRFAKSGDLKVDSQKNTHESVGANLESNGKKVGIDASSVVVTTHLTWAI